MALRFFVVPVSDSSAFEQDLNGFLASHKVVSIDRQLIDQGANSFWAICVDYLSHTPGETNRNPNLSRNRVDYKTVLPPEEFEVFSRLRSSQGPGPARGRAGLHAIYQRATGADGSATLPFQERPGTN